MNESLLKLDNLVKEGKILQAFDTFFADNVITSDEIGNITSSKAEKRGLLELFLKEFKEYEEITLVDSFLHEDTSYSNFRFVFKKESGERFKWDEVIIRKWKENLVVSEFYSNQDYAELKRSLTKTTAKKAVTKTPVAKKTAAPKSTLDAKRASVKEEAIVAKTPVAKKAAPTTKNTSEETSEVVKKVAPATTKPAAKKVK